MKKLTIISAILVAAISNSFSQGGYYIDGLRLSENNYGSTARSASMASASASLGGDLGSISINPASIGVFKRGEFSFTPTFNAASSSSNYLNNKADDSNYQFSLGNIGAAFTFNTNNRSGWMGWSLAIGYNRTNELTNSYIIEGQTNKTNFGNNMAGYANGTSPDQLYTYWEALGFNAVVIDSVPGSNNQYYSLYNGVDIKQSHIYSINGSTGEYYFGLGGNFNDQLYIGATLNIKSGYYKEQFDHTERDINGTTDLASYTFHHEIGTNLRGFNMKFGAIYKPIDFVRLGFSIHTPTIMNIDQESDSRLSATTKGTNEVYNAYPKDSEGYRALPFKEEYTVTTPFRAVLGAAFMFEDMGVLSCDYEFADYKSIKFTNFDYTADQTQANNDVKNAFQSTHNIRIGAEAKLNSFYLRGGYAYYMSPYSSKEANKNANSYVYSGGIGYRVSGFYMDFGYSLLTRNEKYYMYNNDASLSATNLNSNYGKFMATVGFKF